MKILNFYLLAINVVIVNAQDINLSVRVVKYKDANDNVVTLADSEGTSMALRFLNADTEEDNNVEVSWVINIINPHLQISGAWLMPHELDRFVKNSSNR